MILFNNRYISAYRIIFFLVDTALLLGAAAIGYSLRFGWDEYSIMVQFLLIRSLFFAFVFQVSFYYFELYELKIIRESWKFGSRFVQSIAATLTALMISYYMIPNLYLGRGVLLFTVSCAIPAVFFWRIIYRSLVKANQMNERIIILGTGAFAREITREIREKGDSGFEVIGHIDDQKEKRDGKPTI
jgi:FlaA1/EpsC-like NDP-sugar epimerase